MTFTFHREVQANSKGDPCEISLSVDEGSRLVNWRAYCLNDVIRGLVKYEGNGAGYATKYSALRAARKWVDEYGH